MREFAAACMAFFYVVWVALYLHNHPADSWMELAGIILFSGGLMVLIYLIKMALAAVAARILGDAQDD